MKVIKAGTRSEIFPNTIIMSEKLNAACYTVAFHPQKGFWLEDRPMVQVGEQKLYGDHEAKLTKVMQSYCIFERNLGILLSGAKGIGKSLFMRGLAVRYIDMGKPVIFVDRYVPGIAEFINQIEQECMVVFDEFDKVFGSIDENRGTGGDPQTEMLTLFDGTSVGKKLFVITCNKISELHEVLINRPGRFHYHFRFEYPTPDEVRQYLKDNCHADAYRNYGEDVVMFTQKVDINYDCLRAIAFELNLGESFSDAINCLNIVNTTSQHFRISAVSDEGKVYTLVHRYALDSFSNETYHITWEKSYCDYSGISFIPTHIAWASEHGNVLRAEECEIEWENLSNVDEDIKKDLQYWKQHLSHFSFDRIMSAPLHYAV